jgi:hypothetical protein
MRSIANSSVTSDDVETLECPVFSGDWSTPDDTAVYGDKGDASDAKKRAAQERGPGVLAVGARKPVSRPQDTCVRLTTSGHPLPPAAVAGGFDKKNVRLTRKRSHRRVDQSFPSESV